MEDAFPGVDLTSADVSSIPPEAYDWRPTQFPVDLASLGIFSLPTPSFTTENGAIFNNIDSTDPSAETWAANPAGPDTATTDIINSTGIDIKVTDEADADIASVVYTYAQTNVYSNEDEVDAAGASTTINK